MPDFESTIEYIKPEKTAQSCMRITEIILWAILLVPTTVILLILETGTLANIIIVLVWIFAALCSAIVPKLRYERYRYCINEDAIRVKKGFIWITEQIVPMERLHKIQVSQGPIARIYNLSTVCVTTAGGDVNIQFLTAQKADEIAEALKKKINEIAISERK